MTFVTERIAALQHHRDVQGFVENARKGMRRIQPRRRQHRQHFILEITVQPATLTRRPLLAREKVNVFGDKGGAELILRRAAEPN